LNLQFRLDQEGKWHLVSRIKSGRNFSTGFNNAGIGNGSKFDDHFGPRELYLKYDADGNSASIGALSVLPSADVKGVFSYDEDGWVDGARLETTKLGSWAKRVSVTVGRIDKLNTPSLLQRDIGAPNFIQVHVVGNISQRVGYVLEGTNFSSPTAGDQQFLRAAVSVATKDIVGFIDSVVIEQLFQNSSKPLQGFAVTAKTALSKTWSLSTVFSSKGHDISAGESTYAPREDFYREGDQVSVFVTKKIETTHPMELSFGLGKTVSGPVGADQRAQLGLFNHEGLRVDTKLKIKF
jgi:hypothetical protein